jgi:hypothetical protein
MRKTVTCWIGRWEDPSEMLLGYPQLVARLLYHRDRVQRPRGSNGANLDLMRHGHWTPKDCMRATLRCNVCLIHRGRLPTATGVTEEEANHPEKIKNGVQSAFVYITAYCERC